jgi:integrase
VIHFAAVVFETTHACAADRTVPHSAGKEILPSEEQRLLRHAPLSHVQRLIIAALESGCRRGELLNLRWADVNLPARELTVRAEHTKDREQRVLPISSRLAAVLEMSRTDPGGANTPRLRTCLASWASG